VTENDKTPPEETVPQDRGEKGDGGFQNAPERSASDRLGIVRRDRSKPADVELDRKTEVQPWERDDAPKGSTSESLMSEDENGKPVVSGPTHYSHLANGEIVGSYGIGTHHDSGDGPVPVVAHFAG